MRIGLPERHQHRLDDQLAVLPWTHATTPEYKSRTTQRYRQCSAVRTYVISVTYWVLGAVAVKSRSKWLRVPAGGVPDGLVRQRRRWGRPPMPAWRIRRATR